ncbi:MAG: serpin family protein [Acetobacterium sp.]
MKINLFVMLLSCTLLFSGCSVLPGATSKGLVKPTLNFETQSKNLSEAVMSDAVTKSIRGSNESGYTLMKGLLKSSSEDNLLISPMSLSIALAMVQNGANGQTKEGILTAMQDSGPELNNRFNTLLNYFNQLASAKKENGDEAPPITLNIANSFWFKDDITPKQDFVNTLKASYNAEAYQTNFSDPNTLHQINLWVEEKTNHLLTDTLSEINPNTVAYLMNTVYFKGTWINPFDESQTTPKPFNISTSEAVNVAMMHQEHRFNYFEDDSSQIAGMPYYGGSTMYILLPKGTIETLISESTFEGIATKLERANQNSSPLILDLPKFQYQVSNDLKEPLSVSGMEMAFSSENADFSNMFEAANGNVFISDLFQNATIIVDEQGTEATAVTAISMDVTSAPSDEPKVFNCNRPFMFVIQENQTGSILFIGVVRKP